MGFRMIEYVSSKPRSPRIASPWINNLSSGKDSLKVAPIVKEAHVVASLIDKSYLVLNPTCVERSVTGPGHPDFNRSSKVAQVRGRLPSTPARHSR